MAQRRETEPVETVKEGYDETQPASSEDVERAIEQEELLSSSPATTKDRSTTGQSRPKDFDDVTGPAVTDEPPGS